MRTHLVVATAALGLWTACQRQPAPPDIGAAKAALEAADRQYAEATLGKNLDAFMGFYTTDASMHPATYPTASGQDAIRAVASSFFQDPAFAGTINSELVEVSADGTTGHTFSTGELTATGPDGKPIKEQLRDFHLWRRQADGSWKIVLDIWNLVAPPAATAPTT
jgi:uncharacterized protein (TIGR02246 family)